MDEMDWIRLHEIDTSSSSVDPTAATTSHTNKQVSIKEKYIPAPTGAAAQSACPICQERFDTVWHEEAQEWVWMDAVRVAGRVFHASCHDEVSRAGGGGGRQRSATPDTVGVLGKRKAEVCLFSVWR